MTKNDKDKLWSVYIHTTPSNKKYVGMTSRDINKRWGYNGRCYKGQIFYRAIEKYGWNNIKHEIIKSDLFFDRAKELEIALIAEYKTTEYEFGYNMTNGGDGHNGMKASDGTKKKMSDNRQGIDACGFGKFPDNNTKKKMSISAKNKTFSTETKRKMSVEKKKEVYQYSLDGEYINSYDSASEAGNQTNINIGNICSCCRRMANKAGGYFWSYEKINDRDIIIALQNKKIKEHIKIKGRNEKSINQFDLNGNIINTYASIKNAAQATGITSQEISQSCKNPNKVTRFFKWRLIDESSKSNNG